jgi:hypothetical protein
MFTALAVIVNNNKILIGKLKNKKLKEYGGIQYVFPSAQTERMEDIQNEVIKEVKMQTNLGVVAMDKIGKRVHPITQNLTEYFLCRVKNAPVSVSPEADIEKFIWVSKEEISTYMPSLFEKVKDYLQIA